DTHSDLRILGTQRVWASHYNVENNPDGIVPNREYVWNAGGTFWCLGMKTESFATHIVTSAGGRSELLGAFFRDHDVPPGDNQPYFRTTDGELTATYLAYDWGGGHTRALHAVETRQGVTREVRLTPGTRRIGLYAAAPVAVVPPVLPTPWSTQTVGAADPAGSASASNGVFTIVGLGADIWGAHDAFRAVAQPITGDCDLVARVDSVNTTSPWAKAGVMLPAALQDDAAHAMTVVTGSNGVAFQSRSSVGGGSSHLAGSKSAAPRWVRMSRRGSVFSSYESTNGTTWTLIGKRTITMPATLQACLVVTSHAPGVLCTAVISQPELTPTSTN
ncbi:MAG: DUF1349 domain-containing protein, partial [Ilumatobacteraceae bacterium]|nr:DUF1349 domain-containing protein [Ilumatobacteraceae bacterium]